MGPAWLKASLGSAETAGGYSPWRLGHDLSQRPKVLVIDDGELGRIREVLGEFDVDLEHLRGHVIRQDLEGSFDVVIAAVKRILEFEDSVDLAELAGKPTWVAVHGQDFLPLRVRLQKMGIHFLVQSSVGSAALHLLLMHVLYKGSEKRAASRLPVGSAISVSDDQGRPFRADLLDLTQDWCRLVSDRSSEPETALSVEFPPKLAGGQELSLPGRVLRSDSISGSNRYLLTVVFDDLDPGPLELLHGILEGKVIGTLVTRLGDSLSEHTASLTIPSAAAREETPSPDVSAVPQNEYPHQRRNPRVEYTRHVTVLLDGDQCVVLGRDLSLEGMRADPIPGLTVGTEIELAIYGTSGAEPVLVQAFLARDEGPRGTVFRFNSMADWDRPRLENIIANVPEIHQLSGDQTGAPVAVSRLRRQKV